jgi:hypothetical protein
VGGKKTLSVPFCLSADKDRARIMLLRSVVISWFFASAAFAVSFKKCCPEGESVQSDVSGINLLSPATRYSCLKSSIEQTTAKTRRSPKEYNEMSQLSSSTLVGHNLLINSDSHWPSCGESRLIARVLVHPHRASLSGSCIDVMSSQYYVFSCEDRTKTTSDSVNVYRMKKCCDVGSVYDIFGRRCVTENETSVASNFRELLHDKVVAFDSGLPECKPDEALVEYHSLVHLFKIYENSLIVTLPSRPGPAVLSSFCLETTINSTIEFSDDDQIHPRTQSKFIAKVCRPRVEVCDEMPCVRKCCREGSRKVFVNGSNMCEPHESHLALNFYNFDLKASPEVPTAMEPNGESKRVTMRKERGIF